MSFIRKNLAKEGVDIYTCPKTEIVYAGLCPIERCPANIAHTKKPSGCIHNFLAGKREIGIQELAYTFGLTVKETKAKIEAGEAAIKRTLLLNTLLAQTRSRAKLTHCPKCGVIRTTPGPCMRTDQCTERMNKVTPFLKRYPLNIPELSFAREDMFRLLNERLSINKFLTTLETEDEKIRFRDLLALTKPEFIRLRDLRTIV